MGVVDASIGIKTAVNFHEKKNKLGTYCPPLGVFYDTMFLQTLEQRHISNGAAEILKMACIKDEELFNLLEQHAEDLISNNFQVSGRCNSLPSKAICCCCRLFLRIRPCNRMFCAKITQQPEWPVLTGIDKIVSRAESAY
jgi:3-dehydroquinate synthase